MSWSIQAVLVNRNLPQDEALQHAINISGTKPIKLHKTKNYYRYRIRDPKLYDKFRTKKVNKDIRIIFGESSVLEGGGIFEDLVKKTKEQVKKGISSVKKVFSPSSSYNNISTKTLAQYGNMIITDINVVRTPIQKLISTALNLLSAGKFDMLKRKYNYDTLFHLSLMCNVGGKFIYVEKNEVVNISPNFTITDQSQIRNVDLNNKSITINQMLQNTLDAIGNERFFTYDAFQNNCQDFLINILKNNNLGSPDVYAFIKQDVSGILRDLPPGLPKIARTITDIGAIVSRLKGEGQKSGYIARLYASNKPENKGKIFKTSKGVIKQPIQFKIGKIKSVSDDLLNTRIKDISTDFYNFVKDEINKGNVKYSKGLVNINKLWKIYTSNKFMNLSKKLKQKDFIENLELEVPESESQEDYFGEFKPILIEEDFPKFIPKFDPYTGEYYMDKPSKPKTKKIIPKPKVKPSTPKTYSRPIKSFEFYKNYLQNNKVPSAKDLMPLIQKFDPNKVRLVENVLNTSFGSLDKNIYKIGNNSVKGARSPLVKMDGTFTKSASNQNGNSLYIILNELELSK